MSRKTKLTIVIATVVAALLGFTGVAYGSNGAAPGDPLYGLDCALENIGIGDGGLEERVGEAAQLIDEGQMDEALDLVEEALLEEEEESDENGDGEVDGEELRNRCEALLAAADAVLSNGSEQSLEVRTRVAEKLRWMATTELKGKEFGQAVSQFKRGIADGEDVEHGNGKDKKEKSNNGKANGHSKSDSDTGDDPEPEPELES